MARTKGSKNRTLSDKVEDLKEEVSELDVDQKEKSEVLDELDDLLVAAPTAKEKVFLGYHPITGVEVWK